MSFTPSAAVIVHSLADLDAAVLETLKAEEFLLIHRCTASATRTTERAIDTAGNCFLRVDLDPVLRYQVSATVLEASGLANYHPGRKLSAQALAFANGENIPFQFQENGAVFIYESPTLDPGPGDLPTIEFGIAVEFADLDTDNYPASTSDSGPGGTGGGTEIFDFVDIPAQSAVELAASARTLMLTGLFNGTEPFPSTIPLVATLWDGDPYVVGSIALTEELTLDRWTSFSEPGVGYATVGKNPAAIFWNTTAPYDRTARYILFKRNAETVASMALATPLLIPAFSRVRAPIEALALKLTWPLDGAPLPDTDHLPSRQFLKWVLGGSQTDLGINDGEVWVTFHDADFNPGTDIDQIASVPANNTYFAVSGLTVTPVDIISGNAAPPGDWDIESVIVTLGAADGIVIVRERYSPTYTVAEGNFPAYDVSPILDLAATPDA